MHRIDVLHDLLDPLYIKAHFIHYCLQVALIHTIVGFTNIHL